MKTHPLFRSGGVVASLLLAAVPAWAEIIVVDTSRAPQTEVQYGFQHPAMQSLFFVSPQSRRIAMLPANEHHVEMADPLWRAPGLLPAYAPPRQEQGIGVSLLPTNRDNATYTLDRAHAFSANLHDRDRETALFVGGQPMILHAGGLLTPYAGAYRYGVAYPPPQPAGFNQPARPSNRDNATYTLERAHRFSQDAYRKR